jgi:hypothetical protein
MKAPIFLKRLQKWINSPIMFRFFLQNLMI